MSLQCFIDSWYYNPIFLYRMKHYVFASFTRKDEFLQTIYSINRNTVLEKIAAKGTWDCNALKAISGCFQSSLTPNAHGCRLVAARHFYYQNSLQWTATANYCFGKSKGSLIHRKTWGNFTCRVTELELEVRCRKTRTGWFQTSSPALRPTQPPIQWIRRCLTGD
jgi:hypothetical protein